jgi:DNA-binding NarL/FixJ family response regulator
MQNSHLSSSVVRVLLRTKTGALRRGCADLAREAGDIEVSTSGAELPEFMTIAETLRPHVVLLDTAAHVDFGCVAELRRRCPEARIVLWVDSMSIEIAHHARGVGVAGALRKDASDDIFKRCLRQVANGEVWFERSLLNSLLQVREVRLSPRERQLLRLVTEGLSNKQLAAELSISEGTVKVYLAKLFRKMGVHDRYELALHGLRTLGVTTLSDLRFPNDQIAGFPPTVVLGAVPRA